MGLNVLSDFQVTGRSAVDQIEICIPPIIYKLSNNNEACH